MYQGALIVVTDMAASIQFYTGLLGMRALNDFGANVQLDGGLYLQTLDTWGSFIDNRAVHLRNHAGELYFEVKDIDALDQALQSNGIEYIHPLRMHSWGQRAVRFYDPDHHVIEVAEALTIVVERFYHDGMTIEQVAKRMDVSEAFVKACLAQAAADHEN